MESRDLPPSEQGVKYEPQEWVGSDGHVHSGERLSLPNGRTGYLDWDQGYMSHPGIHTARMFVDGGGGLEILVESEDRSKGVGSQLMEELVKRITDRGYERLLVIGATLHARGFYDRVFGGMQRLGSVESTTLLARSQSGGHQDFIYDVTLSQKGRK